MSMKKGRKSINLVLQFENISKEDIFVAIQYYRGNDPKQTRTYSSLLDNKGGEFNLKKINGLSKDQRPKIKDPLFLTQ